MCCCGCVVVDDDMAVLIVAAAVEENVCDEHDIERYASEVSPVRDAFFLPPYFATGGAPRQRNMPSEAK